MAVTSSSETQGQTASIPALIDENLRGHFNSMDWDAMLKRCETQRTFLEQQWFTNLSFYRGNQWAVWMKNPLTDLGVAFMKPKTTRKRLVYNRVKPMIRNEFTKLVKEEGQFFIRPNTSDQADVAAAKTGEALTEWLMESRGFNNVRRRATWWATLCGTGFTKTSYDTGAKFDQRISGVKSTGADAPDGNVLWEPVSPFHIFVPFLDREEMQDQPWVIHARTYDPKQVEEKYGIDDIQPDTHTSGLGFETRFLQSINVRNTTSRFRQVYVKELWMRPCKEYPEGLLAIWASGKLLALGPLPYAHKELPFQKITHIPSGGFYGYSTIEDLISPQKEYNLTRSQLAEARDLTSKPALVVDKGSVDEKKIKAIPGQIISVQPGAERPQRLINPDMPQYVLEELQRTVEDMDEISGQYEVSKGRTPPGVEAATAIAYLQEENNTRLYHTIASIEEAVSICGTQALMLIQQYWPETRIIHTVSKTHAQGAIEFKGSDLKNNTDLRVVSGSMAPRSMAAKQSVIMELMKMQVIEPDVALPHLGLAETNLIFDELNIDRDQAKRENLRMARGEKVEVNDFDDDMIHVPEHDKYRKSQEYEMLPDEIKAIFAEHDKQHKTIALAEKAVIEDGQDGPGIPGESSPGSELGGSEFAGNGAGAGQSV